MIVWWLVFIRKRLILSTNFQIFEFFICYATLATLISLSLKKILVSSGSESSYVRRHKSLYAVSCSDLWRHMTCL